MFRRRRRRRNRHHRGAPMTGPLERFLISFHYVSVVSGRVALSCDSPFLFAVHPFLILPPPTPLPPSSSPLDLYRPPTSGRNLYPSTYLHISCRLLFSRTGESLRSLSWYLLGGPAEDERLDVETKWTIVQLFALGGASASHPTRAV